MDKLPSIVCETIKTTMRIREKSGFIYDDKAYNELKLITKEKMDEGMSIEEALVSSFKNYEHSLMKRYDNGEFSWRDHPLKANA